MTQQQKRKGDKIIRVSGGKFITSELVWSGGRVGQSYTPEQQFLINKIIGIRSEIRQQVQEQYDDKFKYYCEKNAKNQAIVANIIYKVAERMKEKSHHRSHNLKIPIAQQLGISTNQVRMKAVNQKVGRVVIAITE